jgi:cytosine/adenosine deaminase-related metal-dependent hydrolase
VLLRNVSWRESFPVASVITVEGTQIRSLGAEGPDGGVTVELDNAIAFPGLVNAHDHLEFDLFPRLANRTYADYIEWGLDIQQRNRAEIDRALAIPEALRLRWGVYKNLLAGVTTVVHHGPTAALPGDLVGFVTSFRFLHSWRFGARWRALGLPSAAPIMVHIAEGTSAEAAREPDRLHAWNVWRSKVIGVHGIAMTAEQARRFAALVWCPVSNLSLYGQTAAVETLKESTPILFGTDSTLTAGWNIWEHLRVARKLGRLADAELHAALTERPAEVFSLPGGRLAAGQPADLTIARRKGDTFWDAFFAVDPEDILMVLRQGRILLVDEELWPQVRDVTPPMDRVLVGRRAKRVAGGIAALARSIERAQPDAVLPVTVEG